MKSDHQIQLDVLAELNWEPSVSASDVGVSVKDGIVTLSGHVKSYAEKWHAEQAAQRVAGVKALAIELEVTLEGNSIRNDVDIARSAENVLEWLILPKNAVKVVVEKGWITLSGTLNWEYQRLIASTAVRYLMGVTGVSNQIAIQSGVNSTMVKSDIEAALKRSASALAQKVNVEVKDANVTLTGAVHNWTERELVRHSAWGTPGVHHVVDNMTIAN